MWGIVVCVDTVLFVTGACLGIIFTPCLLDCAVGYFLLNDRTNKCHFLALLIMKFETAKTLVAERLRSRQLSLHGVLDLQWRVKSVDAEGEDAWWDMPIPGGEDADAQCMTIGMLLDVFDSIVADDGMLCR